MGNTVAIDYANGSLDVTQFDGVADYIDNRIAQGRDVAKVTYYWVCDDCHGEGKVHRYNCRNMSHYICKMKICRSCKGKPVQDLKLTY